MTRKGRGETGRGDTRRGRGETGRREGEGEGRDREAGRGETSSVQIRPGINMELCCFYH